MSIRPVVSIVYGVQLNKKEQNACKKAFKNISLDMLTMMWIEELYKKEDTSFHYINFYSKFNENNEYMGIPFWDNKEDVKDLDKEAIQNLKNANKYSNDNIMRYTDLSELIWFPFFGNDESYINSLIGWQYHRTYHDDSFYCLFPLLKASSKSRVIKMKGTLPWETGINKTKNGDYFILNGEHILPRKLIIEKEDLNIYYGSVLTKDKNLLISKRKELWDKYHGDRLPLRCYPHEGWNGSDPWLEAVNVLYKIVSNIVPEVNYDVLRLDKFVCLYWS